MLRSLWPIPFDVLPWACCLVPYSQPALGVLVALLPPYCLAQGEFCVICVYVCMCVCVYVCMCVCVYVCVLGPLGYIMII